MPKILYIGSFSKVWDEEGTARGLEANGCEVIRMSEQGFDLDDYKQKLEAKPDIVLFAKLKVGPDKQKVVDLAKQKGITTVCWMPDLYWGLSREYRIKVDPIFKADYVFSPDGGERDWGKVNHHLLRQAIPDKYCYVENAMPTTSVVFVGSLNGEYPYRTKLVKKLMHRFSDRFEWYGNLNTDEMRGTALNKLYARAGVVIGESVYAPHYWSNRLYETLGRGGFMVHPKIPGLCQEYTPYEHYIPYNHGDFDGLFEIIDYYMNHPEKRKAIGRAAHEHTKLHHTMSVRCKQFLAILWPSHDN